MVLPRTLEPEVMDTEEEARDYDEMDHREVNGRFCDDLLSLLPRPGRVLDAGTGTARIPIELCRRASDVSVCALELATFMLAIAQRNVEQAGLADRIRLQRVDAKATPFASASFDAVISNSLVHHIPEPREAIGEMWRLVRPGGVLFVRDLARPESRERIAELLARHAPIPARADANQAAAHRRQRTLFEASLHAALTVDEVAAWLPPLGIPESAVRATSDRHWTLSCAKP